MMQRNIPVKRGDGGSEGRKTTTTPCCSKEGLKRGPWTLEEDELLARYVKKEGEGRWRTLPKRAGLLRCGKSCRLRWMNYLRPSVKRGPIAPDEEDMILRLHCLLGNRWSLIAGRIPGRTDNEIKNYWNTHLSKKLISQGIDPRTHKPLQNSTPPNPNPDPNSKPEPAPSSFQASIPTYLSAPLPPTRPPVPSPIATPEIHPPITTSVSLLYDQSHDHNVNFMTKSNDFGHITGSRGEMMALMMDIPAERSSQDVNRDVVIGDVDCSTEDIFSSFLNSLINEDIHIQQPHMQYSHAVEPFDHVPSTANLRDEIISHCEHPAPTSNDA